MTKLLIKTFIKDCNNVTDKNVREKYGILAGILGILCNIFLFLVKLIIGITMNSIAIISEAFNNLSDTGSSVIAIISSKMSNKKPDKEHPYGHGRFEYISSLFVALFILIVGFELIQSSMDKILHPSELKFSVISILILTLSLSIKLWMFLYNRYIGNLINSEVQKATAQDSINDIISTGAVIITTIIGKFLPFAIDGYVGLLVSVFILYSGFKIVKQTVDTLLGTAPDPELVRKLTAEVLSGDGIAGVHDLIVHDYGPGRVMASVHAEVPDDVNIVRVHEVIDDIETRVFNDTNVHLVIHMDPISVNCERTNAIRQMVVTAVMEANSSFTIHDFRMTDGENTINLIFDVVMPAEISDDEKNRVIDEITEKITDTDSRYRCVITVDRDYT